VIWIKPLLVIYLLFVLPADLKSQRAFPVSIKIVVINLARSPGVVGYVCGGAAVFVHPIIAGYLGAVDLDIDEIGAARSPVETLALAVIGLPRRTEALCQCAGLGYFEWYLDVIKEGP
jgi:hypothetical protein